MCANRAQNRALVVNDDPAATRRGQRGVKDVAQRAADRGDGATTLQHLGLDRGGDPVGLDPAEGAPAFIGDQDPAVARGVGRLRRSRPERHGPLLGEREVR